MTDAANFFGSDLSLGPTGDIATVSGSAEGVQRVLRRLYTNPGAYIWQLSYGAGLPGFIGQANPAARISAVARRQMLLEPAVAPSPAPTATVAATSDGTVTLTISYTDAATGANVTQSVPT